MSKPSARRPNMVAREGRREGNRLQIHFHIWYSQTLRQMSSRAFSRPVGVIPQPNAAFSRKGQSSIRIHEGDRHCPNIPRPSRRLPNPWHPKRHRSHRSSREKPLAQLHSSTSDRPRLLGGPAGHVELLCEGAAGGRVPRDDCEDSVGVRTDRCEEARKRGRGRVGAVCSWEDAGGELREKVLGERGTVIVRRESRVRSASYSCSAMARVVRCHSCSPFHSEMQFQLKIAEVKPIGNGLHESRHPRDIALLRRESTGSVGRAPLFEGVDTANESTYFLLASAPSEHGWNVAESQPAVGSKVWIETRTVFESKARPPATRVRAQVCAFGVPVTSRTTGWECQKKISDNWWERRRTCMKYWALSLEYCASGFRWVAGAPRQAKSPRAVIGVVPRW